MSTESTPDLTDEPEVATPTLLSRLLPTGAAFLVITALLVLSLDGLREIATIGAPMFLAFTLVLTVDPLRRALVDRGWPVWLATVSMLVILYAVLLTVLGGVGAALTVLVTKLPTYQPEFEELYNNAVDQLARINIEVGSLSDVLDGIEPGSIVPYLQTFLGGLGSVGTMLLFILLATMFLTLDLVDARTRLAVMAYQRPHLAAALREFSHRIRRYWLVSTIFGALQAAFNIVLLLVLGVPLPFTWGMLAFVTSYIPNVGFVVGLVPAATLALLDKGPATALGVVIGYVAINFVLQTLIMPKYAGDAVGLNVTTTFLSLVFWSIIVGPLGALLAIPLTLFARTILIDSSPRTQWLGTFIASSDLIRERHLPPTKEVTGELPDDQDGPDPDDKAVPKVDLERAVRADRAAEGDRPG